MEVMASIDEPKDEMMHQSSSPDLEPTRVSTMSLDQGLGALARASNRPSSLDPFPPWLSFSELATKLSISPFVHDSHFIRPSRLDGHHQGASISHDTTHDEYL